MQRLFDEAIEIIKAKAPYDTGNLAEHCVKSRWNNQREFEIYVDTQGGVTHPPTIGQAPYMVYTNEPWISEYWKGKQNPNEHWWNDVAEFIILYITRQLQGTLIKG